MNIRWRSAGLVLIPAVALMSGCAGYSVRQKQWLQPREAFAGKVTTIYPGGYGGRWEELADALIARGYLPALEPSATAAVLDFGGWDTTDAEFKTVNRTQDVEVGSVTNRNYQTVGRLYERRSYEARVKTSDEFSDGVVRTMKEIFPGAVAARGGRTEDVEDLVGAVRLNCGDSAAASEIAGAMGIDVMVMVSEVSEGVRESRTAPSLLFSSL